jgi:hypothetical protein
MCYQIVERYDACRCLYYRQAIDPCPTREQSGHTVQEKTVLVGYTCSSHKSRGRSKSALGYDSSGFCHHSDVTSFDKNTTQDKDTIQDKDITQDEDIIHYILQVLLEDSLLR